MSAFGEWTTAEGLPAFEYRAGPRPWDPIIDPPSSRHVVHVGNRRITLVADTDGRTGVWDEHLGCRWLAEHTGVARFGALTTDTAATKLFGPTFVRVAVAGEDAEVVRTVLCPEGEVPWVLIRVDVVNRGDAVLRRVLTEEWVVRPRLVDLEFGPARDVALADAPEVVLGEFGGERDVAPVVALEESSPARDVALADAPEVVLGEFGGERDVAPVVALEESSPARDVASADAPEVVLGEFGGERDVSPVVALEESSPARDVVPADAPVVALEECGGERVETAAGPLRVAVEVEVAPGGRTTLWFRFGLLDRFVAPAARYAASLSALRQRLPTAPAATVARAPEAATEIPWHAALLTGGACVDGLLGGHTLNQGSAYSFRHGFNGAARDPLQHALPLVHLEPDLALSVLRNTCAWGSPDGDLPYALDGRKQPWTQLFRPSDQNLWALWLAAEYAAATGDLAAFSRPVPYHPCHGADPVPLGENLRRQFRFFADVVGVGEHGHVRILNADWNDLAISASTVDRELMVERGESVLNSAMAAWVLPVYAGLAERLGDPTTAAEARQRAADLRERVAGEWNGRWFRRAHAPGAGPIGENDLWLEVQPWAILCGAATPEQARALLRTIDEKCRAGSPLGARLRWPVPAGQAGQVWFSVNATLVWAAVRHDVDLAWDEWRRMTLHAHSAAYPGTWTGTLSGPDCYLAPESDRPGETWALPELGVAMQAYPVANLHSHSQPLFAHLRLLGVEPAAHQAG